MAVFDKTESLVMSPVFDKTESLEPSMNTYVRSDEWFACTSVDVLIDKEPDWQLKVAPYI